MEILKSMLFPWEKPCVSYTNPLLLQLKLLRALNAPVREKTLMHALQLFQLLAETPLEILL